VGNCDLTGIIGDAARRVDACPSALDPAGEQAQHRSYSELTDALVEELGKPGRVWVHGRQMIQRITGLPSRHFRSSA
jgi:hypothetical protein